MKEHYGVSHWPDEKAIFAKMDRLVNEPLHHIKPEAMRRYLDYFDTKCKGSKAMIDEAKKSSPAVYSTIWPSTIPSLWSSPRRRVPTYTTSTATGMWTISRPAVPLCWAATTDR